MKRYIPVPIGNSISLTREYENNSVYPCTYRERFRKCIKKWTFIGISLYLQGTRANKWCAWWVRRYIPVPTGNAEVFTFGEREPLVYPCTYRELTPPIARITTPVGISLYLQGTQMPILLLYQHLRYIPVPTGNSTWSDGFSYKKSVYPCTYRELV